MLEIWVKSLTKMKFIVLIILVNPLSIKRKRKKLDQLSLSSGHGNQEQPFTKPNQGTTYIDKRNQVLWIQRNHVSLDLTKRRYNLLTKARRLVSNNSLVAYAFSEINCSLVLKFNNNTFHYFNSEY